MVTLPMEFESVAIFFSWLTVNPIASYRGVQAFGL